MDARSVVYDAATDTLLLGSPNALTLLDGSGEPISSVTLADDHLSFAGAPFQLLPRITVARPPENASTSEPQPDVIVRLEALCNDAPCVVPPSYAATLRLTASLDGAPITDGLRIDAVLGQASFTPQHPFALGDNRFSALAIDRFGHASNAISTHWTLLEPARGLVVEKAKNNPPTVEPDRSGEQRDLRARVQHHLDRDGC